MSEKRDKPGPERLLADGDQGSLTTPQGDRVPVRVADRRGDFLLLVLLLSPADHLDMDQVQQLLLECTSARGLVTLRGEAALADRDLVRFRVLDTLEVVQRREHVRVRAARPVLVAVEDRPPIDTFAVDVSGGGMLLAGPDTLEPEDRVRFVLRVESGSPPIEGAGRVVRAADGGRRAIVFEGISGQDRERLIHFVFDRERAARRVTRDGEL